MDLSKYQKRIQRQIGGVRQRDSFKAQHVSTTGLRENVYNKISRAADFASGISANLHNMSAEWRAGEAGARKAEAEAETARLKALSDAKKAAEQAAKDALAEQRRLALLQNEEIFVSAGTEMDAYIRGFAADGDTDFYTQPDRFREFFNGLRIKYLGQRTEDGIGAEEELSLGMNKLFADKYKALADTALSETTDRAFQAWDAAYRKAIAIGTPEEVAEQLQKGVDLQFVDPDTAEVTLAAALHDNDISTTKSDVIQFVRDNPSAEALLAVEAAINNTVDEEALRTGVELPDTLTEEERAEFANTAGWSPEERRDLTLLAREESKAIRAQEKQARDAASKATLDDDIHRLNNMVAGGTNPNVEPLGFVTLENQIQSGEISKEDGATVHGLLVNYYKDLEAEDKEKQYDTTEMVALLWNYKVGLIDEEQFTAGVSKLAGAGKMDITMFNTASTALKDTTDYAVTAANQAIDGNQDLTPGQKVLAKEALKSLWENNLFTPNGDLKPVEERMSFETFIKAAENLTYKTLGADALKNKAEDIRQAGGTSTRTGGYRTGFILDKGRGNLINAQTGRFNVEEQGVIALNTGGLIGLESVYSAIIGAYQKAATELFVEQYGEDPAQVISGPGGVPIFIKQDGSKVFLDARTSTGGIPDYDPNRATGQPAQSVSLGFYKSEELYERYGGSRGPKALPFLDGTSVWNANQKKYFIKLPSNQLVPWATAAAEQRIRARTDINSDSLWYLMKDASNPEDKVWVEMWQWRLTAQGPVRISETEERNQYEERNADAR